MAFEILIDTPTFERIMLPFVRNLKRLGIDARIRLVDDSQYINRLRSFDFDMAMLVWGQSESPGNEQRDFWSSAAADQEGSRNYAGIKDPVVDKLIEMLITAPDREGLVARSRALDRVLTWGFYVIPAWYSNMDRVLYWDKYDYPAVSPDRGVIVGTWWFDAEKAAQARRPRGANSRAPSVPECGRCRKSESDDGRLHRPPPAPDRADAAGDHADQFPDHPDRPRRPGRADDRPGDRRRARR